MIEINLTPKNEIRTLTWIVPDLLILFGVIASALLYSNYELNFIREEIQLTKDTLAETSTKLRALSQESKNYYTLKNRLETINNKIFAINKLTQNQVRHYKSLILIELLQTHRPNYLWLSYIDHDDKNSILKIGGSSLESRLIAVFIQRLKDTKKTLPLESQFLSQIHFSQIALEKIAQSESTLSIEQENAVDSKLLQVIHSGITESSSSMNSFPQHSMASFTDVKGYPSFKLNLKYELRQKSL